jgi:hypothetical protein
MSRTTGIILVCCIFGAMGAGGVIYALTTFPFGTLAQPGPGFYSALIAGMILVTALACIVETMVERSDALVDWPNVVEGVRSFGLIASLAIAALAMLVIGFLFAAIAIVFAILSLLEPHRLVRNLVASVVVGVATNYLFVGLLDIHLPRGWIG